MLGSFVHFTRKMDVGENGPTAVYNNRISWWHLSQTRHSILKYMCKLGCPLQSISGSSINFHHLCLSLDTCTKPSFHLSYQDSLEEVTGVSPMKLFLDYPDHLRVIPFALELE